jgi:hemolysin activation/secretion protein
MYTTTGADQDDLDNLGRANTDDTYFTMNGSVYGSFYLDPLLDSSWKSSKSIYKPLVHEIFGSLRGQYAFDYRLTPLSQYTMGGLYTVRGFAQSITAGDNALVGTIEYRMHIPRMFSAAVPKGSFPSAAKPFKWAPDSGTGAGPDWDLVLDVFFDAGTVSNNEAYAFEVSTPMYSAGVGLDLTILQNVSVGVDWGWALNSIDKQSAGVQVDSGSSQFWFTATILY